MSDSPTAIGPVVERPLWNKALSVCTRTGFSLVSKLDRALSSKNTLLVEQDVAYLQHGQDEHRCDIWAPKGSNRQLPSILFVHGGGFRSLSKEVYWMYAQRFAEMGFVVCTINYRLAPEHPCPAAIQDAHAAYSWWQSKW